MKLQIASDLHLEFLQKCHPGYRIITPADADVLVLAGDIANGTNAIDLFSNWPVPVIYICGNHEFYGRTMKETMRALRDAACGTNVHFLENDEVILKGVRFLGASLWTDYELYMDPRKSMDVARHSLNDHDVIRVEKDGEKFRPEDARKIHLISRAWLEEKLAETFDGPTVVVTHHGPHIGSMHPQFVDSPLNPAFYSDLTPLMGKACLWIHGHTHNSSDYRVSTRVIANPAGYPQSTYVQNPELIQYENQEFKRDLVVEVPLNCASVSDDAVMNDGSRHYP